MSNINLNGLSKLFYPVVWLWKALYEVITPRFWGGVVSLASSEIPLVLRIIILMIVAIFILCFYIIIWAVLTSVTISLAVAISIVYGFAAVVNVIGGWWEFWSLALRPKLGILS